MNKELNDRDWLEKRRKELQEKIDKTTDYFFIYGYVKQLEQIEEELFMLQNQQK